MPFLCFLSVGVYTSGWLHGWCDFLMRYFTGNGKCDHRLVICVRVLGHGKRDWYSSFVRMWVALKKAGVIACAVGLLGAGVLGDSLGALADGVLCQLAR